MLRLFTVFCVSAALLLQSCAETRIHDRPDLGEIFHEHGISDACFIMRDHTHESIFFYNEERCLKRYSPASTFKIFNALVALESGKAPDEQLVIPWDSVVRSPAEWNRSMNMREAFQVSNVPYFQEIARRVGKDYMKHYLDTVQYGNRRLGPSIDQFWLNDTLQISADEQAGFMKRLYFDQLPFSDRSQRIVRSMMLQESTPQYKLYYKTGTQKKEDSTLYRITGFAERIQYTKEHEKAMNKSGVRNYPYFFAQDFTVSNADTSRDWQKERLKVLHAIFQKLNVLGAG